VVPIPAEAKLGVRFHVPRSGVPQLHRRDPMSQDVFDLEANFTYANNSAFKDIKLNFPSTNGVDTSILVNGTPGQLPADASIPHNFKDVLGVRLGGDYNVLADRLAIRLGTYFESQAQSAQYQNIDFAGQWRLGFALGGTYRIRLGNANQAFEISIGYGHTIIGDSSYTGDQGIPALGGAACNPASPGASTYVPGTAKCPDGTKAYRTEWAVNLGKITNSFDQFNLGLSYRF
jgi:long-chain fatty acid transport protein